MLHDRVTQTFKPSNLQTFAVPQSLLLLYCFLTVWQQGNKIEKQNIKKSTNGLMFVYLG